MHLKHFRIERRIASGGMGDVYLGYDTSLSRPVAIKTVRSELVRDETFLARFVREATAQANVVHPHVVQVYYVGQDQGVWFLAMQIVDGGSLLDGLSQQKKMRWQDAARHMRAVCEGLCVAERLGIVHRDIKPSNILLDREGRAMLSDFGLAASSGAVDKLPERAEGAPAPESVRTSVGTPSQPLHLGQVTQLGVMMGTPEYIAPEQLKALPVDARADMYALGATFFHLVTGGPIFKVTTLAEARDRYNLGHHAPSLRAMEPGVPRAFADVIDRCLAADPAKRFATMAELLVALEKAAPQPEVIASPPLRALVWLLDLAPFAVLGVETFQTMPWLAPVLFLVAGLVGSVVLGSTPGIWLMRLRLRTTDDGDVSVGRGFARFLVQHGWYLPLTVGWSALYASSDWMALLPVGIAWLAVVVVGSLGAFARSGRTLHDVLTKTRVLVDVRYR
jgi:serine/threonine-protein kinase